MIDTLPQIWTDEIAKGSEFGLRIQRQLAQHRIARISPHNFSPRVAKVREHVGVEILKAFETALGRRIGCGECKRTLLGFGPGDLEDVDAVEDKIYRIGLEIPVEVCDRGSVAQRHWIRGIIENVAADTKPQKQVNTKRVAQRLPLIGVPIDRSKLQSHILYHVMPLSGDTEWVWRRHCNWLREVRHKFNGRLIVGIVTPGENDAWSYCPSEAVREALRGLDAEFIESPNDTGSRKKRKHARQKRRPQFR